jgi:hypothetical protein
LFTFFFIHDSFTYSWAISSECIAECRLQLQFPSVMIA